VFAAKTAKSAPGTAGRFTVLVGVRIGALRGVIAADRLDRPTFRLELIAQVNPWISQGSSWQRMPSASAC
jgi:hypothetical protein